MRILIGGSSAQFWGPMAIAVIFGLTFATLLTLVMVPTMYTILEDLHRLWARVAASLWSKPAQVAAKVLPLLLVLGATHEARAEEAPTTGAPVTLLQAIAAAEQANYDYLISQEQTYQSALVTGQAWSVLQPRVSVGATYNINQYDVIFDAADMAPPGVPVESDPIVIQEKQYWTANATISQPILHANAPFLLKGSYRLADAARLDQEQIRYSVFSGTARAFYDLAVARETLEVAEATLETRTAQLDLAERQAAAGLGSRSTELQAELLVHRAERAIASAQEQVIRAEETFHRATRLPRSTQLVAPEPLTAPSSLEQALQISEQSRPDLMAAHQRIVAARMDLRAKQMEWLPTLDARFTYSFTEAAGFVGQNTQWMGGLDFKWQLWDGGLRIQQSKEKSSQLRIAEYQRERQVQQVEQDVRTSWIAYERAQYALQTVKSELALAEDSLTLSQRGFEAGSSTWLDLRQAELDLRRTQVDVISERMNRDMAVIDLLVAMGTPRVD